MAFGIKLIQGGAVLAAGTSAHPAPIVVDTGVLCYLSFTGSTTTYRWSLVRPDGSAAVIASATSPGPTFLPDVVGGAFTIYLVDDAETTYVVDIQLASPSLPGPAGTIVTESYDIRTYGAVEGSSDSLAAINAAIVAASTSGVRIVKVLGTYSVAGTIVGKTGVVLEGSSQAASFITQLTAGAETYLATSQSDCGIRRLSIVGAGGAHAVRFVTSSGIASHPIVDECQISGFGSAGTTCTVNIGTDVFTAVGFSPVNGDCVQFTSIIGSYFAVPTFTAATDRVTIPGHGLSANDPIVFNDYDAAQLPAPLTSLTTYYVKTVVDANNVTLSATPGGALIDITGAAGVGAIATWGALPTPLDPRLEYYVVNASGNTFKVSLTSGGAAIDVTAVGSTPLKVARVYAGVALQANGYDMYSARISRTLISGALGDGGARCGVLVERVPGSSGTVVHATLDRCELGGLNKRGATSRNGEMHGILNHIYNILDGSGGGVAKYADGAYSLFLRGTRLEQPAIDRIAYLTSTTNACVLEGTRGNYSYSITDLGTNNEIEHSNNGSITNTHTGYHTFRLRQDAIAELTAAAGVRIGDNSAGTHGVLTVDTVNAYITGSGRLQIATGYINTPNGAGVGIVVGNLTQQLLGGSETRPFNTTNCVDGRYPSAPVATTDNTLTKILGVAIAAGTVMDLEFTLVGYRTGGAAAGAVGDCARYIRRATFKNVGGVFSQVGVTDTIGADKKDDAAWGNPTVAVDAGAGAKISAVGAVNMNITWTCSARTVLDTP